MVPNLVHASPNYFLLQIPISPWFSVYFTKRVSERVCLSVNTLITPRSAWELDFGGRPIARTTVLVVVLSYYSIYEYRTTVGQPEVHLISQATRLACFLPPSFRAVPRFSRLCHQTIVHLLMTVVAKNNNKDIRIDYSFPSMIGVTEGRQIIRCCSHGPFGQMSAVNLFCP